jgi:GTP-binding protein
MFYKEEKSLVDTGKIYVKAGDGGNGAISFRREKYVPHGGPDGGDGGNGGNVFLAATTKINTLSFFQRKRKFFAENGENGSGGKSTGKSGKDEVIYTPVGTIVKDYETDEILCDLDKPGKVICLARGGEGGKGNTKFKSSINQVPRIATKGIEGEEREVILQLKILADIGLIGLPNVGKSSIISKISNAKPKIANYNFTTLKPNLGVVNMANKYGFIVADVPGLIEGAHTGIGLGYNFLKHVERCKAFVHVLDISGAENEDIISNYYNIRKEIEFYNPELLTRKEIVVGNKCDFFDKETMEKRTKDFTEKTGKTILPISAVTGFNLDKLKEKLIDIINENKSYLESLKTEKAPDFPDVQPLTTNVPYIGDFKAKKISEGIFKVFGPAVDHYTKYIRTNADFQIFLINKLEEGNLTSKLLEQGAQEGDTVIINGKEFDFKL